ncbi:Exodeoxyribonuclease VII large subunit [hydrothermal vent metagenome]|uniref:Exodeoxyribonuclease VII large subunit n=1 Tax=hydrothermal vent metagenome TaxID=652676 RepID=A0A160TI74_9ZZZZ
MAVPVLADLRLTLAAMGQRTERCVRRYHERGRERLDALVRVIPKRDALLGPQRQRADDLGARLDRGLERRVTLARGVLDRSAGALRLSVLERRLDDARIRLDRTWRLAESLNPDRLLERGYVRVSARPSGMVITTSAAARTAGAVTLHFRDGPVDARVERAGGKAYDKPGPEQPSLL